MLEQLCAANEAANRAKSQFLANMSHEIRTPLTAIMGFTDLLRSGADGGIETERQDYLKAIHISATHLLELISDILDLSRIEAGRMEICPVPCSFQEILSSVMSIMGMRAREKHLELTCEWPDGAPATVLTDALRLKQLLMNLVGNAVKFTSRGSVRVVCRLLNPSGNATDGLRRDRYGTGHRCGKATSHLRCLRSSGQLGDAGVRRDGPGIDDQPPHRSGDGGRHHGAKRTGKGEHVHGHDRRRAASRGTPRRRARQRCDLPRGHCRNLSRGGVPAGPRALGRRRRHSTAS